MVSVQAVQANIASKLLTTLSSSVRADSQFADNLESIGAGETKFQLQAFVIGESESADSGTAFVPSLSIGLSVHHRLGASETEQDYVLGAMQTESVTILAPDWWSSIAGVFAIDEEPKLEDGDRVGNVVSYTLTVTVAVNTSL